MPCAIGFMICLCISPDLDGYRYYRTLKMTLISSPDPGRRRLLTITVLAVTPCGTRTVAVTVPRNGWAAPAAILDPGPPGRARNKRSPTRGD